MAEYHNLIYFKDSTGLYVNLYIPSEVTWEKAGEAITLVQDTRYPDADTSTLIVRAKQPIAFPLRFRMPSWTRDSSITVNGAATGVRCTPGQWAEVSRTWQTGDRADVRIPLVLVLEAPYHDPYFRLPERDDDLATWLVPEPWSPATAFHGVVDRPPAETMPTVYRVAPLDKTPVRLKFRSFYEIGEGYPYFMYFDRKSLPWRLW